MAFPKGIPPLSESDFDQIESEMVSCRPPAEQRDRIQEHLDLIADEDD